MYLGFVPRPLDGLVRLMVRELSIPHLLHEGDEAVLLSGCFFDLPDVLFVQPELDPDHGALLRLGLKVKPFILIVDVESDFSGPHIDVGISGVEEGSPKDEWRFLIYFHVEDHEVDRDEAAPDFHRNVFGDPRQ